jgi:hypothetical protein
MRNRALHRRLVAIEAKSDEASKAIERERRLAEGRRISPEQAERTYREFITAAHSCPQEARSLSASEAAARYLRMVRGPAPPQGKRCQ